MPLGDLLPVLGGNGHPAHEAGTTRERGLAFVGLRFQRVAKSDLLYGAGEEARLVVDRLLSMSYDEPLQTR